MKMETTHWPPRSSLNNQQADVNQSSISCDVSAFMTMSDSYAIEQAYGGSECENLNFAFDDYYFNSTKYNGQMALNNMMDIKQEQVKMDVQQEALPVLPTVKIEPIDPGQYNHCFDTSNISCLGRNQSSVGLKLDTAFSPTSDLGSSCSASPAVESDSSESSGGCGFEVYQDLIMRHLIQDIQNTCHRLNIPRDPKVWTSSQSITWLMDMSTQYHLSNVPYEKLNVDGATLSAMNIGQFVQCFPNGGETVHAQLQIWNSANEYYVRQNNVALNTVINHSLDSNDEQVINISNGEQERQFIQMNPGGVIQRLRNVNEDAFNYPLPFFFNPTQEHVENRSFPLGPLIPVSSSSSENIAAAEVDFGAVNAQNGASLDISGRSNNGNNIHLWQFLRELLEQHEKYGQCVRWIDHSAGIFKIEDSHTLARLWGKRKNRPAMNYDKLSRSLRQYYKKNILKKTTRSQRLVYQFMHPYHVC